MSAVKVCMILPSGVLHNKHGIIFVPPEVEIIGHLSSLGYEVTWVLSSEVIIGPERSTINGIHTLIVPLRKSVGRFAFSKKFIDYLRKIGLVRSLLRKERFDVIFLRNDVLPALFFDGLLALSMHKKHRTILLFQIENPMEQNLESRLIGESRSKIVSSTLSWIERIIVMRLMNQADIVIPVGASMKDYLLEKGISSKKMIVLPQGVDMERFLSADGQSIRTKYELDGSKIIVYSGSMNKERNLGILIRAFADVRKNNVAKLLMVGGGNDKENLIRLAEELGIASDILFVGWFVQRKVPNFIAAADIGVCLVPPLSYFMKSSPLKMLEYMALGKPVVANLEIPEQRSVIQESEGGVLVEYEIKSIAKGLEVLLRDFESSKVMGKKGQSWIMKTRSYDILVRQIEEELTRSVRNG